MGFIYTWYILTEEEAKKEDKGKGKEKDKEKEKEKGDQEKEETEWPHWDLHETDTRMVIHVDLPGVEEDDVVAEYFDNKLVIRGMWHYVMWVWSDLVLSKELAIHK